jgi:ABC-type dipeptide/oligopeptide/nickel transport system ATPase component
MTKELVIVEGLSGTGKSLLVQSLVSLLPDAATIAVNRRSVMAPNQDRVVTLVGLTRLLLNVIEAVNVIENRYIVLDRFVAANLFYGEVGRQGWQYWRPYYRDWRTSCIFLEHRLVDRSAVSAEHGRYLEREAELASLYREVCVAVYDRVLSVTSGPPSAEGIAAWITGSDQGEGE